MSGSMQANAAKVVLDATKALSNASNTTATPIALPPTLSIPTVNTQYAQNSPGLGSLNVPKITTQLKATIDLGKTLLDQNSTISDINQKIANLEKAAPGTVDKITTSVEILNRSFADLSKIIPQNNIPPSMKPHIANVQNTADSFTEFARAYKAYTNTPDATWYNPFSWGAKTSAAITAKSKWDDFNDSYNKTSDALKKDPNIGPFFKVGKGLFDLANDVLRNL